MLPAAATPGSCRRNTNPYLSTSKYSIDLHWERSKASAMTAIHRNDAWWSARLWQVWIRFVQLVAATRHWPTKSRGRKSTKQDKTSLTLEWRIHAATLQTPPLSRLGSVRSLRQSIIYQIRTNANTYQYYVWKCINVIQSLFKRIQCVNGVGVKFCHPCYFLLNTEVISWYIGQKLRRGMHTSIIHVNHIVSLPKAGHFDHYWPNPSCKPLGTSTKSPMTKHNPTVRKYFQLQSSGHFGNASCGCPSGCICWCWSVDLVPQNHKIKTLGDRQTASAVQMSPYTERRSRAWKHAQLMAAANQKTAPQLQNLSATLETHESQRMYIWYGLVWACAFQYILSLQQSARRAPCSA